MRHTALTICYARTDTLHDYMHRPRLGGVFFYALSYQDIPMFYHVIIIISLCIHISAQAYDKAIILTYEYIVILTYKHRGGWGFV